jgi:predicted nucleic acid-binding protein
VSRFFDTSILVHAQQQGQKAEAARRAMAEGGVISVQVVNEFANVSRRKLGKPWPEIEDAIRDVLAVMAPPIPVTLAISDTARRLSADHQLSLYDALIIAAALQAGCTTLLTEDMQAGRRFGDLTIVNPFADLG